MNLLLSENRTLDYHVELWQIKKCNRGNAVSVHTKYEMFRSLTSKNYLRFTVTAVHRFHFVGQRMFLTVSISA